MGVRNAIASTTLIVGLIGAVGNANANIIDSTAITIWSADTPGATITSATQQALPTAAAGLGVPVSPTGPFVAPINYNDTTTNTIAGFFASESQLPPPNCGSACQGTTLSSQNFAHATLFEVTFVATLAEMVTLTHDDGVSLFLAGTEGSNSNDLLPINASAPTESEVNSVIIGPGVYDIWYSEDNGLPATLQADAVAVPAPIVGAGLPGLIIAAGGLLALARRRRKLKA